METNLNIDEYFKSLGDTSEKVADSLKNQGIKGVKLSTCHCPIVNAVYKAIPDYWPGLKIHSETTHGTQYRAKLNDAQIFDPKLPGPVQDFIADFDYGKYPDLEVKEVKEVTVRIYK